MNYVRSTRNWKIRLHGLELEIPISQLVDKNFQRLKPMFSEFSYSMGLVNADRPNQKWEIPVDGLPDTERDRDSNTDVD